MMEAKKELQRILNRKELDEALKELACLNRENENQKMAEAIFKALLDIKSLSRESDIWHK